MTKADGNANDNAAKNGEGYCCSDRGRGLRISTAAPSAEACGRSEIWSSRACLELAIRRCRPGVVRHPQEERIEALRCEVEKATSRPERREVVRFFETDLSATPTERGWLLNLRSVYLQKLRTTWEGTLVHLNLKSVVLRSREQGASRYSLIYCASLSGRFSCKYRR